ncbi:pre-rRNA-processing protein IPI3, partial [Tremellales sp. Uapishka_1]
MATQEIILSGCSEATSSASRLTTTPALHLHDLLTSAHVHAFKTSTSSLHSVSYVQTRSGVGGVLMAVQEGKALVNIWAWQKDQQHLKLHLPEKLSCFSVSPNGCWAAGGSSTGQIYLWELASGLLLSSFTAHYRTVTSLTFTNDSHLLLSASLDASVHVFLVSRLVDEDDTGRPYGTLGDHTLGIRAVAVGKTAGSSGGRCWTASDDGTVKIWSLHPPFNLLCTFAFPPAAIPTTLAVDPSERFFYAGTSQGNVHHVPLFHRRGELGAVAAVGNGFGASTQVDHGVIAVQSPVTCLALSISATHLLTGTQSGEIHIHALPSHQHLRTITSHAAPITHLSTLTRPLDLIGTAFRPEHWPVAEVRPFERLRVGRAARDVQEVTVILRPSGTRARLERLRAPIVSSMSPTSQVAENDVGEKVASLEMENKKLKASLERALKVNEKMWSGIVDMKTV